MNVKESGEAPSYPEVPQPFKVITGNLEVIWEKRKEFFDEVVSFLGIEDSLRPWLVEENSREIYSQFSKVKGIESNDIVTFLVTTDRLASVVERRTEFNYVEASFAHYLNPELIYRVKGEVKRYKDAINDVERSIQ